MNEDETKDRMVEDDKDSDGQITWKEYLDAVYAMTEEELKTYRDSDLDTPEAQKQFDIVSTFSASTTFGTVVDSVPRSRLQIIYI